MDERIVHRLAVAGGVAGERPVERVVAVAALRHERGTAVVSHADDQVALRFVALRKCHVARHGECLQQVTAGQVAVAELLFAAAVQEACRGDAAISAVSSGDGVLYRAVLGVCETRGAAHGIAHLGDEVCNITLHQGIRFLLTKGIVADGASTRIINNLRKLAEVVVCVSSCCSTIGIRCPQQKSASLFIAMRLDYASCIRGILNRQ